MTEATTDRPAPAAEPQPQSFAEFEASANASAAKEPDDTNSGDVEPPATEEGNVDDGENGTVNDEAGEGEEPKPKGKPIQERFNAITHAKREAEREAAEARRDAEYWKAKAMGGDKPAAPEAETANDDGKPDPGKFEFGEADPEYIDARARWAARQEFEERHAQAERNARIAAVDAGWNTRIAEAVEHIPDFNERVLKAAERGDFEISETLGLAIKASPVGPDIASHLADNPVEASRISRMPIAQAAYEFGKLEARMEAQAEARKPAAPTPVPTASKAPPPPANLARGAGGRFSTNPATDDFAAFEALAKGAAR